MSPIEDLYTRYYRHLSRVTAENINTDDNADDIRAEMDTWTAREVGEGAVTRRELETLVAEDMWRKADSKARRNTTGLLQDLANGVMMLPEVRQCLGDVVIVRKGRRSTIGLLTRDDIRAMVEERAQNVKKAVAALAVFTESMDVLLGRMDRAGVVYVNELDDWTVEDVA